MCTTWTCIEHSILSTINCIRVVNGILFVRHTVHIHAHACTCNSQSCTHMRHACHRLCCSVSLLRKIGYGENGEFLFSFLVLCVYAMDPHGRKCCGLSRDVAWRFRLFGWCAMCFGSARSMSKDHGPGKLDFCNLQVCWRPSRGPISKSKRTSVARSPRETPLKDRLSLDPSSPKISRCTHTHTHTHTRARARAQS